jgi:hypothetical protein
MIRIIAPHFVAGAELSDDNIVIKAAPIIKYMESWPLSKVLEYCHRWHRQWEVEIYESIHTG